MIILPSEYTMILAQDHIKDFNREPAAGSDGHVSDHKTIVDILLTIPNARIMYGQVWKADGQWYKMLPGALTNWSDYSPPEPEIDDITIDFNEVRRIGETPGMIYIAGDPLDLADGVTDYKEDLFPDQTAFMVYSAGLFGLDQVVPELIQEVHSSRARLSTLESDNASLNETVSGLEADFTSLSSSNDTLSSTVSTLEGNVTTLTSDKEALEGQVSTLESTIANLTARLEALENPTTPE